MPDSRGRPGNRPSSFSFFGAAGPPFVPLLSAVPGTAVPGTVVSGTVVPGTVAPGTVVPAPLRAEVPVREGVSDTGSPNMGNIVRNRRRRAVLSGACPGIIGGSDMVEGSGVSDLVEGSLPEASGSMTGEKEIKMNLERSAMSPSNPNTGVCEETCASKRVDMVLGKTDMQPGRSWSMGTGVGLSWSMGTGVGLSWPMGTGVGLLVSSGGISCGLIGSARLQSVWQSGHIKSPSGVPR